MEKNSSTNITVHRYSDRKCQWVQKIEEEEEEEEDNACWASYGRGQRRKLPPALPLLARTANLSCHMPWSLQRTYRSDGSLVIKEVRVKHHEYFRARREKGRLTLRLVELDENCGLFEPSGRCKVESAFPVWMKKNVGCTDAISQMSPLRGLYLSRVKAVNV